MGRQETIVGSGRGVTVAGDQVWIHTRVEIRRLGCSREVLLLLQGPPSRLRPPPKSSHRHERFDHSGGAGGDGQGKQGERDAFLRVFSSPQRYPPGLIPPFQMERNALSSGRLTILPLGYRQNLCCWGGGG